MCLITDNPTPYIAGINISGWKYVFDHNKTWAPMIISRAGELKYNEILKPKDLESGKDLDHLEAKIDMSTARLFKVHKGFHAFSEKPDFTYNNIRFIRLVRVIIPKESEIFFDRKKSEIVASRMIVFRTWWDYLTWKLKHYYDR